ncbi:hypothetical protein BDN70DRAFT_485787 [Pholiota conissans]|uniref:Uncharacterized protein n=1 Tax=Pholiota conissans TaxID=109636 RepID=A0A9P5Z5W2_9AGAR|nr:hypothetical protein BDN70DRAFT_485787 [Pholiota conissans]
MLISSSEIELEIPTAIVDFHFSSSSILAAAYHQKSSLILQTLNKMSSSYSGMEPEFSTFEAIMFPSDGRPAHCVSLMTSPSKGVDPLNPSVKLPVRMPHPEVYMDYVPEELGVKAWKFETITYLEGMTRRFTNPYVVFYPVVSRDGLPFPVNKNLREMQGSRFNPEYAWRGNLVVGKYRESPFSSLMDASMADFPLIKNWFSQHGSPQAQR